MGIFEFSFNSIAPIILCALLGWFIRYRGHVDEKFIGTANGMCFRYLFPCMVFNNIYSIDFKAAFDLRLLVFCTIAIVSVMALAWLIIPRIIKERQHQCIFIVQSFRSNNVIYAIPIAINMFGEEGAQVASMLVPLTVIVFNFLCVVCMVSYSSENGKDESLASTLSKTALDIIRNPMIIGSVIGIATSILQIQLPLFLKAGIGNIGGIVTPFALILLGMQMDLGRLRGNLAQVFGASLIRLIIVPLLVLPFAILFGFSGPALGSILVLFSAPGAVTILVMARNYNIAPEFAAQTVILSTVLSMFTIFTEISLMRYLNFF